MHEMIAAAPEQRGRVARAMLAQDARWAMDVVLSGQVIPALSPFVGLLLSHHFVRIAYEGAITLRSNSPHLGVPELAGLLDERFESITARVRHATKLLDDTKKSFDSVVEEFEAIAAEHKARFVGKARWFVRWLETDLGLYYADGRLLGATFPVSYRMAIGGHASMGLNDDDIRTVAEEWGGMLVTLASADLQFSEPAATLDLTSVSVPSCRDRRSDRYLERRYEPQFPAGLKLLLLTVESDISVLGWLVSATAPGHEEAVFRVRLVTLFHALSTLRHVVDRYEDLESPLMVEVAEFLRSEPSAWLLGPEGKALRNRCVHYPIHAKQIVLDDQLPMFGIVEAVTERAYEDVSAEVEGLVARLGDLLSRW